MRLLDEILKNARLVWGIPALFLMITLLVSYNIDRLKTQQIVSAFEDAQNKVIENFEDKLINYSQLFKSGSSHVAASNQLSQVSWQQYVARLNLAKNFPGIESFAYAKVIDRSNKTTFQNEMQDEINPNFKIKPDGSREFYAVPMYVSPRNETNIKVIGEDLWYDPKKRGVLKLAIDTNTTTLSGKVPHIYKRIFNDDDDGFMLFSPHYSPLADLNDLDSRRQNIEGFVYGVIYTGDMIESFFKPDKQNISIKVYEGTNIKPTALVYKDGASELMDGRNRFFPKLTGYKTVRFFNQTWTIYFETLPNFAKGIVDKTLPLIVLLAGVCLSLLLFIFLNVLSRSKLMAETIASERSVESNEARRFSELVINNIPDLIFVKDKDFKIVQGNKAFFDLYSPEEREKIIGTTTAENFSKKEQDLFFKYDRIAFDRGYSRVHEVIKNYKGETLEIDTAKVAFKNSEGEEFILGIARDISELQNTKRFLEDKVQERTDELKQANEAKDVFLANMSHELRTPLNSILGLVKVLLQEDEIPGEHKRTLEVVDKSAYSLLEIVNDVLDISKIEAGKMELENRPFNVSGLMFSLIDQIRPLASKKGLNFSTNEDTLMATAVIGDEFRLSRIILNLLSNAVKYTKEGSIDVTFDIVEKDNEAVEFSCSVKDTGIGIAKDKLDAVFEKFTQAENSTQRRFGGTGLGLNIVKQLVELMGGTVNVESELGKGSTFSVTLPFLLADGDYKEKQKKERRDKYAHLQGIKKKSFAKSRLLIAEDHEFNQVFIIKLMKRLGAKNFHLVVNGEEAIKEVEKEKYDFIFMDCHMPEVNGYQATEMIRKKEAENKEKNPIPIIAMTADAMVGTRELCLEAGMNEYITKPIDEGELKYLLSHWFTFEHDKDDGSEEHHKAVDLSILRDFADNDPDTEKELLDIFFKKSKKDMKLMSKHLKGGKDKTWSEIAHSLKGSAAYVGAEELRTLCGHAQDMIEATGAERKAVYKKIEDEYEEVCKSLKNIDK